MAGLGPLHCGGSPGASSITRVRVAEVTIGIDGCCITAGISECACGAAVNSAVAIGTPLIDVDDDACLTMPGCLTITGGVVTG